MPFAEEDIDQITASIWTSILGLEVQRRERDVPTGEQEGFLTGSIEISGTWSGAVALHCSVPLAHEIAAIMFGVEPEAVQDQDMRDAVGELTNMLGGNLKSLLPEPCVLSLPTASEGFGYGENNPSGQAFSQVAFDCHGQPLWVSCVERVSSL